MTEKTSQETFTVKGEELKEKIREIIKEGNARKIIIKNKSGKKLIEFPVTVGVIGVAIIPVWIAIGTIAAIVTDCTIAVEHRE